MRSQLAEWRWSKVGAVSASITDLRTGRQWGGAGPDFALVTAAGPVSSDRFKVDSVKWESGRVRVVLSHLGVVVTRDITAYDDVAGFRVDTTVQAATALALKGARLAQVRTLGVVGAQRHAFRAGADWREPGWSGARRCGRRSPRRDVAGDERRSQRGRSVAFADATLDSDSLFFVTEANDLPSVRMSMTRRAWPRRRSTTPATSSRLGPFEEQIHVENDRLPVGRVRVVPPGERVRLPTVFVGFGHGDGDEAWQFHQYLTAHRGTRYEHAVTFNSNGTNTPGVSLGAKDGMNQATIAQVAPLARRLGVETFILDDGWQADSGDWIPTRPASRATRTSPTYGRRSPR